MLVPSDSLDQAARLPGCLPATTPLPVSHLWVSCASGNVNIKVITAALVLKVCGAQASRSVRKCFYEQVEGRINTHWSKMSLLLIDSQKSTRHLSARYDVITQRPLSLVVLQGTPAAL